MSHVSYLDRLTSIYMTLIPKRDQVKGAEERLKKVLANAHADGHDPRMLDEAAFDKAAEKLAVKTRKGRPPSATPGLEDTPFGKILARQQ